MQGELTKVLAGSHRVMSNFCLPPELGLSSNDRSFCDILLVTEPGAEINFAQEQSCGVEFWIMWQRRNDEVLEFGTTRMILGC